MKVLWDFIVDHPLFAIFMFGMSISAVTLVVWRILLNINAKTNMNQFLPVFQEKLEKDGVDGALRFCKKQTGVIPRRLFTAGLETSRQGLAAMRRSMANVIELEITPELNTLLPTILAIAKIATMVGLLGTVISMIGTFSHLQEVRKASAEVGEQRDVADQGKDIGLALVATAMGLITAIPLVFAHVLFKAWVANFEIRMKNSAQKLLLLVQAIKPVAASPPPAPKPVDSSVTRR
jgi:biopolymer transport protein ExbB